MGAAQLQMQVLEYNQRQWMYQDETTGVKAAVAVVVGVVAFACMLGHHPYAALGAVVLGTFLLFGSQFFVNTFVGG